MAWFSPEPVFLPEIIGLNGHWLRGKPAVITDGETISWPDFSARTARVANGLLDAGLAHGDRVVLLMCNSLEMTEAIFGSMRAGLTVVPLNVSITDEAVRSMIADSGARAVIASDEHVDRIEALRPTLPRDIGGRYFAVAPKGGEAAGWRGSQTTTAATSSTAPAPPGCPRASSTATRAGWHGRTTWPWRCAITPAHARS
jgi:acyl-CoA synthetase (AMP-forming)/AMP-acid ligase II